METQIKTFEETDFTGKNGSGIYIDDVAVTYCQDGDCTENMDDVQTITISSRNNGVSRFLNLKTENWSIDGIADVEKIINDFYQRAGIKKENDE